MPRGTRGACCSHSALHQVTCQGQAKTLCCVLEECYCSAGCDPLSQLPVEAEEGSVVGHCWHQGSAGMEGGRRRRGGLQAAAPYSQLALSQSGPWRGWGMDCTWSHLFSNPFFTVYNKLYFFWSFVSIPAFSLFLQVNLSDCLSIVKWIVSGTAYLKILSLSE